MADIVEFPGETIVSEPPVVFLERAKAWGMDRCIVVGLDETDKIHYGSSFADIGDMLIMIELFKREILEGLR